MVSRMVLALGSLLVLLVLGLILNPKRVSETAGRTLVDAQDSNLAPQPVAESRHDAGTESAWVERDDLAARASAGAFGENGSVSLAQIPAGRFRDELQALAFEAQSRAMLQLEKLKVPVKDLTSLHVDHQGGLFYACATLDERLPEAARNFAVQLAAIQVEATTGAAAVPIASPPIRHSKPGATKIIYLDFNGHNITGTRWNDEKGAVGENGYRPAVATYAAKPLNTDGDATMFGDAEQMLIVRVWERVAEDFKPFDVDVTTEEPVHFTATTARILITDSVDANGVNMPNHTAAGVAYLDVFGDPDFVSKYSPALVYADKNYHFEHYIAETASHEAGHNLSLSHDGDANEEYYGGHGFGETSWNTIMGGAFYENVTQWSKGEYPNANNTEDDLAIIAGHLGYQADDHTDSNETATPLTASGQTFSGSGFIGQTGESDRFSFTAVQGLWAFTVMPFRSATNTHGGNLDVAMELYDSSGALVSTYDPVGATAATSSNYLTAGTYHLRIYGVGSGSSIAGGYSSYGSLGQYIISSSFVPPTAPSITSQPSNQAVYAGQATQYYVSANGNPAPSFRWQRLPSGGGTWTDLAEGGGFAGTGTANLSVTTTLAMNGDQFRCVASNSVGSATSNGATLTVQAATPPSIYSDPYSTSTVAGTGSVYFSCYASGTDPLVFRWQHLAAGTSNWLNLADGNGYSGSGSSTLTINPTTLAMNGDRFRCVVTNGGGSDTSTEATLTVTPVIAPTVSGLPSTLTVNFGESLWLSPNINGTYPLTIQWYRNNVEISGANYSSFSKYNCTTADSGSYHVTVSNSAGSVTSGTVVVTVNPVIVPAITTHPTSVEVSKGFSASFNVSATGSPTLRYQWYKDGEPIAWANSSYYSIYSVTDADTGGYTVTVTNDGGSVTSSVAELVVLPAQPPQIQSWTNWITLSPTDSGFSVYPTITGSAPLTYQWYKDGVAIPGATNGGYYNYNGASSVAGVYTLRVSNESGTASSPDLIVALLGGSRPWIDSGRQGDTIYFIASSPGRIMRYDLSQEAWLPVVYLAESKVPTAFLPAPEGVFIAYGKDLVRRSLDLQTEVPVATSTLEIQCLYSAKEFVFYQEGQITRSWNRATLAAGFNTVVGTHISNAITSRDHPVYSPIKGNIYSTRPDAYYSNRIFAHFVGTTGGMSENSLSNDSEELRGGTRQYLSPDESLVIANSGTIYDSSFLQFKAAMGAPFDDLVFVGSTPVALRGSALIAHGGSSYAESGRYKLPARGYAVFTADQNIYAFSAPETKLGNPVVTKVPSASLTPAAAAEVGAVTNTRFSIEDVFIDADGILHLLSRSVKGIVRLNPVTQEFFPTLPLRGNPTLASYAPAIDRLTLAYADGALSDLFPSSDSEEQVFSYFPAQHRITSFNALDELTLLDIRQGDYWGTQRRMILGPVGELKHLSVQNYTRSLADSWQSSNRRLYFNQQYNTTTVEYYVVPNTGVFPSYAEGAKSDITPPLRFGSNGTLILTGSSRILNADLQQIGELTNSVSDGVWTANHLFTIRIRPDGTEVQKWARVTYEEIDSRTFPGIPLRIFRLDDNTLVIVSTVNGYLAVNVVNAALEPVSSFVNDLDYVPARPGFFNAAAYLDTNPDVAATIGEVIDKLDKAWQHYYTTGVIEGRTDGDFSVEAYLAQYPELQAIFGTDLQGAALHWYIQGRRQGRRIPAGFDPEGYYARNSDIAAYFGEDLYGAWLHYYNSGIEEGRNYDEHFRVDEYLALYGDLQAAFGVDRRAAMLHWLNAGRAEGRLGRVPRFFNADAFLARYSDLNTVFGSLTEAQRRVAVWNHYLNTGVYEGRNDGDFDAMDYLTDHADLEAAFGLDLTAAALHWYIQGRYEGRRIPALFSISGYYAKNADVATIYGQDLYGAWLYYRDVGVNEGRSFDEEFRVEEYLALYADLQGAFGTDRRAALLHWLAQGRNEGRAGRVPLAFDQAGYFARNPDVAVALGSLGAEQQRVAAWAHYFYNGVYEGRNFDELFRASEYLALHADLQAAFGTNLSLAAFHWLIAGQLEGRQGRF